MAPKTVRKDRVAFTHQCVLPKTQSGCVEDQFPSATHIVMGQGQSASREAKKLCLALLRDDEVGEIPCRHMHP
jgi:hypothetical protein